MSQEAEKGQDRKSNKSRQKNKRRDNKMESDEIPEIPDRGVGERETSDRQNSENNYIAQFM